MKKGGYNRILALLLSPREGGQGEGADEIERHIVRGMAVTSVQRWCYSLSLRMYFVFVIATYHIIHIHGLWR